MTEEPIEEAYFNWLCAKVVSPYGQNHVGLMRILYSTEFVWLISGDKNRAEDGVELREYFLGETRHEADEAWFNLPCSILEVLVAFAKRASFQTDTPVLEWFWTFITNLELDVFVRLTRSEKPVVETILNEFMFRTYDSNGYGGLFPLNNPEYDQREVEIWYQFCAWVEEKELI